MPFFLTEEQFLQLANDKKVMQYPQIRLAYLLGFYQCMRVSEVVKMLPENYNENTRLLQIIQAKGNKDRNIPVAPEVVKAIKHLPIGIGIRGLQHAIKKDAKRILGNELAGHIHFHTLRHSGATYYLNQKKWGIRYLQTFLGHANLNTTQIYTHVNPVDLTKLMWGET